MREKFTPQMSIPVSEIKLDITNFRYYGEVSSQSDCIDAMLKDKKSRIYALAKDISKNGLTPDPIVLSKDEQGDWIVREGNRRIAALKILGNPALVNNNSIRRQFEKIREKYSDNIPEFIDCIVCDDENCILEYLDRLHTGQRDGTGRITWSPENKSHYDMHRGRPGENALAIKVRDLVIERGGVLNSSYNITNLQRVLQNKDVQKKLKYSWDGNEITTAIGRDVFLDLLKLITERVGTTKVEEIYTKPKQIDFVDKILKDSKIDLKGPQTDPYVLFSDSKKKRSGTGTLPIKPSWERRTLISPKNSRLSIPNIPENVKARNIVKELAREIDVRKATNAAAVLFRVLLELSVERYVNSNKLGLKDSLAKKIRSVADDLHRKGKIEIKYMEEIVKICQKDNLLSAETLQRFVHSFDFSPDIQVLCTLWDNLDIFISECWK